MRQLAIVLGVLLAGCAEAPYDPSPGFRDGDDISDRPYHLGGSFTNDRTQEDIDSWCDVARRYGNECVLMESYPEQFGLRFETFDDCAQARDELLAMPRVRAGSCSVATGSGDHETPTSSPEEPSVSESWSLRGSFVAGYTRSDLDLWCEIAGEFGQTCALMKSEPPQFSWFLDSYEACYNARSRIQAIESVRTQDCVEMTPSEASYSVRAFELIWRDGDDPARSWDMEWDVVRAWLDRGTITINVTTHGIEGGDFRFRVWMTPESTSGGALAHAPGGREPGTFDFLYNESPFWRGTIDRVESVDPSSYVRIESRDDATGLLSGTFRLEFVGGCSRGSDCSEPDAAKRRVLDGRFGP